MYQRREVRRSYVTQTLFVCRLSFCPLPISHTGCSKVYFPATFFRPPCEVSVLSVCRVLLRTVHSIVLYWRMQKSFPLIVSTSTIDSQLCVCVCRKVAWQDTWDPSSGPISVLVSICWDSRWACSFRVLQDEKKNVVLVQVGSSFPVLVLTSPKRSRVPQQPSSSVSVQDDHQFIVLVFRNSCDCCEFDVPVSRVVALR